MSDAVKTGIVKFYKVANGYGFIQSDDGPEIFFHITDFDQAADEPAPGDRVSFVAGTRGGRPRAMNVKPMQPPVSERNSRSA